MGKTLTYSGFAIASLFIILAFVTAKTYTQLAIAVILYPALAYFALKILPRKTRKAGAFTIKIPARSAQKVEEVRREKVEVADIDKRTFLKLVGAAGLSFFIFSLLGRRVEALLFGKALESGITTSPGNPAGGEVDMTGSLPASGYRISEIDDNILSYYGFTNKDSAWLIMREDTQTNSFRYARGDSGFSRNWSKRENLKYDYYYKLFGE